jgi:hypothetical protein
MFQFEVMCSDRGKWVSYKEMKSILSKPPEGAA